MKNGEIYGAILKRLNNGYSCINIDSLEGELGIDIDDVKKGVQVLYESGLLRKCNPTEYEIICDVGQLRAAILSMWRGQNDEKREIEYTDQGDTPIDLEDIASAEWTLSAPTDKESEIERARARLERRKQDILSRMS